MGATNQGRQVNPGTVDGLRSLKQGRRHSARQSHGWFFHLRLGATEGNFWNVLIGRIRGERHPQSKEGKLKLRNKICICLYRCKAKAAPILWTALGKERPAILRECSLVLVVKKIKQKQKISLQEEIQQLSS